MESDRLRLPVPFGLETLISTADGAIPNFVDNKVTAIRLRPHVPL